MGIASNVSPTYIAEVSPAPWRGRLVALNQLGIGSGVLGAQIVNWLIAHKVPAGSTAEAIRQSWNGQFGWRWMFTAVAIPAIVLFAGSLTLPESPRWLAVNGAPERAWRTLVRIGGEAYGDCALKDIQETVTSAGSHKIHWADLRRPHLSKILTIGVCLAVLQQFCGINVLFNYAEEIYRAAGYGVSDVLLNIVGTGLIALFSTVIAFFLVDRLGRRPLMLCGCAAVGLLHLSIGFAYRSGLSGLPVLSLTLAAIACYGVSLAPVTWILISEIFPNQIRGIFVSIAVSALWIACFVVTFAFPLLNGALGMAGTFWLFAGICFAGYVFIAMFVPETKDRTLEDIERALTAPSEASVSTERGR